MSLLVFEAEYGGHVTGVKVGEITVGCREVPLFGESVVGALDSIGAKEGRGVGGFVNSPLPSFPAKVTCITPSQ